MIKFPSALVPLGMSQRRSNSFVFHFNMELESKIKPGHLCIAEGLKITLPGAMTRDVLVKYLII